MRADSYGNIGGRNKLYRSEISMQRPSLLCFTCEAVFTLYADYTMTSSSILGPWDEGLSSEIAFSRLYWELSRFAWNDRNIVDEQMSTMDSSTFDSLLLLGTL